MPDPIAIARNTDTPSHRGIAASPMSMSNGVLGTSFAGASSGSFREAIAASFGKDAADIMDYSIARFSSSTASTDSDMTALPSTSVPRGKLENSFCRNFKCCGQSLENLHDLLQHYEESHVKFEDDDVPNMIADDDNNSASSSATASQPPSPKQASANAGDATTAVDTAEHLSAFDTTIMRSPFKGKKRSFGQFATGAANANGQVHQSLRRALIDGGLGRGSGSRASSIYSANSPFSTPGSSVPGTPTMDTDADAAFFGNGSNAPAFSSLSLRQGDDHDLPSCAPPTLFFPASGSSSSTVVTTNNGVQAPPAKREKTASLNSLTSTTLDSSINNPGGMLDRPYKCTSPGCDKAYKQMNGLKYHRLHGQCNQNNLPPQQQVTAVVNDKINGAAAAAANTTVAANTTTTTATSPAPAVAGAIVKDGSNTPPQCDGASGSSSPDTTRADAAAAKPADKMYICQVGACGKRYKNLNGLRYHYLHSGSHGLLGLQLLHSNGGGASARADATTGRPAISTNDLSSDALAAAAQAAAAQQQAKQQSAILQQQQAAAAAVAAAASTLPPTTVASPTVPAVAAAPVAATQQKD